jgi:hypothetical protein
MIFTSCSSEYDKQLREYKVLLDNTVNLLDSEEVYQSIKNSNLELKFEKLDEMFCNMEENVPNDKIADFIVLRTDHESLQIVIEKGLKWDSLNNLDKLSVKGKIKMFKGSEE